MVGSVSAVLADLVRDGRPWAFAEQASPTGTVFPDLRVFHEPRFASEAEAVVAWDHLEQVVPAEIFYAVEYLVRVRLDGTAEVVR